MKPPIRTKTIKLSVMLALAAILVVALESRAQAGEEATSKGAGAANLIGLDRAKPVAAAQKNEVNPMSCPKCRSEWKSRIDYTARGATKPVVWVEKHLCDGCDTTISVAGHGKAKHEKDMKILKNLTGAVVFSGFLAVSSALAAEHDGHGTQPEQKLKPYTLKICAVSDEKLDGSMGKPFVYKYKDREIKFCCKDCQKDFDKDPAKYIKKIEAAEKKAKDAKPDASAHDHSAHQHGM